MPKYIKKFVNLATSLMIATVISWCLTFPAMAVTQELQFNTTNGYIVKTTFSYDKAQNTQMIREHGHGKTEVIDTMKVSFYKPSGELIADYDNIVDGIVMSNYFEFNFDPVKQQLLGSIDIGGESAGEMYLKGQTNQELSLIEVNELGEEKAIDFIRDVLKDKNKINDQK